MIPVFDDWKRRADECDLLETAVKYGAVLKRAGREHVGPCPYCAGRDRFSVNQVRHKWNCRGHGGGHGAISMVQHIGGLTFLQACEELTGEPNPSTNERAKPLSDAEKAERSRRRLESEARQRSREAEQAAYQDDTREAAQRIWNGSVSIEGSLGETYLRSRGIALEQWPDVLRFHSELSYPKKPGTYPALVARVDDLAGNLTAVWRIYLRADGRKADVENPKLGLGPASGGAVRIGGLARKIAVAEGIESALGFWLLNGCKFPVWASLSTSGMQNVEIPLGVEHVVIAPDGDRPFRKRGHEFEPAEPAGRKAAETLRARLLKEGVACTIAAEPPVGKDMLDLWNAHARELA